MDHVPDGAVPQWDLADRMRKSLRQAGVGVTDIADYLGVSRTSVSNWINGRVPPSTQTLRLWALRCGVSYDWLRDGPSVVAASSGSRTAPTLTPAPTWELAA